MGDGLIRLDTAGRVIFASPNALSAYRRLGLAADLTGAELGTATAQLAASGTPVDEALMPVARGRVPRETEIDVHGTAVQLRAIPLVVGGQRTGALVLVRDVTELRRRDRELLTKDATIREIHHRVKNNLQTVAALLRLQARRLQVPEARAALEESVRRVASIAIVHETLSHSPEEIVDFDEIADRVPMMAGEVSSPEARVTPGHRPVRDAAGGGGDAAGDGAHRAAAERAPARVRRLGAARPTDHRRGRRAAPEQLTVRSRDDGTGCRRASTWSLHEPRPADRADPGGGGARRSARACADRSGGGTVATIDLPVSYEPMPASSSGAGRLPPVGPRLEPVPAQQFAVRSRAAALERPPLVLGRPPQTPASCPLSSAQSGTRRAAAASADLLGVFNLQERGAGGSDREEQLWILLTAGGSVAPVHVSSPSRCSGW